MKVSKQNILLKPSNAYFNTEDALYNFRRSLDEALNHLGIARRCLIPETELDKKISEIEIELNKIEIDIED